MHLHLIENPSAGRGRGAVMVDALERAAARRGHRLTIYGKAGADALMRHLVGLPSAGVDRLIIAGGDGTLRMVLNALAGRVPWPVAMLPVGTANVVARELGFRPGGGPETLAEAVLGARPWDVDVMEVRREAGRVEWSAANLSIGLDAAIVHAVSRSRAGGAGGYARWIAPSLDTLGRYPLVPLEVEVNGTIAFTASAVIVQNAFCYGGLFQLSPQARMDSGSLDVAALRARTKRDVVRLGLAAASGRLAGDRQARIVTCQRVAIRAPTPVALQSDGDPAGTTNVEVVLRPGSLTMLRAV